MQAAKAFRDLQRSWDSWMLAWRKRRTLGARGERAAARWLKGRRYVLIESQARSRWGEVDLIAVEGRTIVFVEVKTRRDHAKGHPAEAVDRDKQRRITRTALAYLKRHDLLACSARFDVIAVSWPVDQRRPEITHYQDAFPAQASFQFFS